MTCHMRKDSKGREVSGGRSGEAGPSSGTARAKAHSDHEFGIWGKKPQQKAKKSAWLDSMARGEVRSMAVGRAVEVGSFRYLWALL